MHIAQVSIDYDFDYDNDYYCAINFTSLSFSLNRKKNHFILFNICILHVEIFTLHFFRIIKNFTFLALII